MNSIGLPGDEDPLYAEPECECPLCWDIMVPDLCNELVCPTCVKADGEQTEATL